MKSYFSLLFDVIQKGETPGAIELLNESIKEEIFELDPEVDLSIMRKEAKWKTIASNPFNTEFTRAAALSKLKMKPGLKIMYLIGMY